MKKISKILSLVLAACMIFGMLLFPGMVLRIPL